MADPNLHLKMLIIDAVRGQVKAGAHYLLGAAGNTPGNSDGFVNRPAHVKLHDNLPDPARPDADYSHPKGSPYTPMIFAAYADSLTAGGILSCGGRCATELPGLKLALDLKLDDALALKLKDLKADQIKELIEKMAHPELYRWPRPNDSIENNNAQKSTVWGESCVGKRHFDCIGLINWSFSTTLNRKDFWYGIPNFVGDPDKHLKPLFEEVPVAKAEACDILTISAEHIGIATEKGTVIHAMDTGDGVVETAIGNGVWKQCFRLPKDTWKMGP